MITAAVIAVALAGGIVLILTIRTPDAPVAAEQPHPGASAATGSESTTASATPTSATSTQPPGPPISPTAAPSQNPGPCTNGTITLTWTPKRPTDQLCVHVTSEIILSMPPIDPDRWLQPTSSDPRVATVGPLGFDQEGVTYTTVTARTPGTATVRATARPQDSHDLPRGGQPRQLWLLVITVIT